MRNKILSMLGLCQKAGRLKSGEFAVESAVKGCEAYLVILAKDASANTKKKFNDMCSFYETDIYEYGTKEVLAAAIGREERAVLAVCDEGFASSLEKLLKLSEENSEE